MVQLNRFAEGYTITYNGKILLTGTNFDDAERMLESVEANLGAYIGGAIKTEPVPEPTETELIQAELLLNQMDIMAKQSEHDEVLAEILLNQLEV